MRFATSRNERQGIEEGDEVVVDIVQIKAVRSCKYAMHAVHGFHYGIGFFVHRRPLRHGAYQIAIERNKRADALIDMACEQVFNRTWVTAPDQGESKSSVCPQKRQDVLRCAKETSFKSILALV